MSTGIPINTTSCTAFFAFTSTIDTLGTFAGMFGSSESATLTITQSSATPEPSSLLLLGSGLLGLAGIKLRRIGC
ncbi:MAG TPA: PEP-CTERM sorting domain-containing protein [Candidatus Acidoferrales bacterium]|nr:PEP-CTERM sorting domain-containing protein [Candidatus Acidoferrales bacterium]